jgi:hypothetical protein
MVTKKKAQCPWQCHRKTSIPAEGKINNLFDNRREIHGNINRSVAQLPEEAIALRAHQVA